MYVSSSSVISAVFLLNASAFPIIKIAIPHENLSSKEYMPNTNAPDFPFVPTTSDIRLMPVARTKDCDAPK